MRMNSTFQKILWTFGVVALIGAVGCGGKSQNTERAAADTTMGTPAGERHDVAVARLAPTEGNNVQGTITFTKESVGVRIVADVTGLSPGEHGFHVHEYGDCSSPDGSSAGGHFNPTNMPHDCPDSAQRHVGDMGNLMADAQGMAHYEWTDSLMTLEGMTGVVGKSVVLHQDRDDCTTQPSGNSGARIACGVIEWQQSGMEGTMHDSM